MFGGRSQRSTGASRNGCNQTTGPEFVAAAQASGVQATLSIPLIIVSDEVDEAAELAGLLNVLSRSMQEFDPVDEKYVLGTQ